MKSLYFEKQDWEAKKIPFQVSTSGTLKSNSYALKVSPAVHSQWLSTYGNVIIQSFYGSWNTVLLRWLQVELSTYNSVYLESFHCITINAFKCNLKELTTKSALSAWGQWSLACACPVAGYIDHVILGRVQLNLLTWLLLRSLVLTSAD